MRLTDCFMELIAYTAYFLKTVGEKQPPYEQVKADVLRSLTRSEECLKKDAFVRDDFDLARFAVCAWVDESILNSPWKEKDRWKREQLQRIYYKTTDAGEEFFERLNALGLHQREVREVYYLCLALGFMGRYCHAGDEFLLSQVESSNLKLLLGSSVGIPSLERADLFPDAYQSGVAEPVIQKHGMHFPALVLLCLGAPVLLYGILFFIYNFALNNIVEHFFTKVI
ncbi:MAG: DotU family type IV/VI secretion system protein [Deltaproteobacteria bacterium]|nr:DotU family type IV/VI secretion system protein [Deltaproteobacteria bacterium]